MNNFVTNVGHIVIAAVVIVAAVILGIKGTITGGEAITLILADEIEAELVQMGKPEIPSSHIGDMVMNHLRKLDYIAYIRFASVYRDFADITDLKNEVDTLLSYQSPSEAQLTLPINS